MGQRTSALLRIALGEWLQGFPWDCWCTWTFDARFGVDGPSPGRCLYHTRRWIEHLPGPPCAYFIAVERGFGGRVHSHGLLRLPDPPTPRRKDLWRSWFERYGRNRVLPYDRERGAAYYIAKYITKEPLGWDVGGLPRSSVNVLPVEGDVIRIQTRVTPPSQSVHEEDAAPDLFLGHGHSEAER